MGSGASAAIAAKPAQPSVGTPGCEGVGNTGPSTAKSSPSAPARSISARVWHDAAHRRSSGRDVAAARRVRREVHAVAIPGARGLDIAIQQHLRAARTGERDERRGECALPLDGPVLFAKLHELQSPVERRLRAGEKRGLADILGQADAVHGRQQQRAQHERVRRQQGLHGEVARRLPDECLPVVADGLAGPVEHAKEMEQDMRVRIAESLHEPRRGASHREAQLFGKFAIERCAWRFAGLELAAGKFPVAGIGFAGGALREQHLSVRALDDGCGNVQQSLAHAPAHAPGFLRRPAAPA